eukprot:2630936-Amphidinium_carterae.1
MRLSNCNASHFASGSAEPPALSLQDVRAKTWSPKSFCSSFERLRDALEHQNVYEGLLWHVVQLIGPIGLQSPAAGSKVHLACMGRAV